MNKSTLLGLMLGISSISLLAEDAPSSKIVAPASKFKKVSAPALTQNTSLAPVKQMTQEKVLATRETSASEVEALQKQIESLQKQLEAIAKQVKEQSKQVKEIKSENKQVQEHRPVAAPMVVKEEPQKEHAPANAPVFDKGYIPVPGTNAGVQIYGMVKLDAIYDGKNNSGDYTLLGNLPYNLQANAPSVTSSPQAYTWKKHFNMHAKQTLIGVNSVVKNTSGKDVKVKIEFDLLGTISNGDSYPTFTAGGATPTAGPQTLTYTPRLRFATITYGGLMVGHYRTNFYDSLETIMPTVDYGSLNGPGRRAQVRYTHKFGNFEAAVAAEQPRADYVTYNNSPAAISTAGVGTPNYVYYGQSTPGNLSKPQRPDFTASLKYRTDNGSMLAVSAIVRDLTIKNNSVNNAAGTVIADGRKYKANGYGFSLAAKIMTLGKSYITSGVTSGKGLGWYLGDVNGRSAIFDISSTAEGSRTYKAIPMTMAWLGYTHNWNDQWQTNVGGSQINLSTTNSTYNQAIIQWFDPGLDKKMTRLCFNTIYKPEEHLHFGLEFMYLQRKSVLGYRGEGNRYQFGAWYKF